MAVERIAPDAARADSSTRLVCHSGPPRRALPRRADERRSLRSRRPDGPWSGHSYAKSAPLRVPDPTPSRSARGSRSRRNRPEAGCLQGIPLGAKTSIGLTDFFPFRPTFVIASNATWEGLRWIAWRATRSLAACSTPSNPLRSCRCVRKGMRVPHGASRAALDDAVGRAHGAFAPQSRMLARPRGIAMQTR